MIKGKRISLVIPCRNEAEGIGLIVKRALKVADEVIVVDNRSIDQTAQVAEQAGARVIKERKVDGKGIGYGYSLLKGMRAAKGEIVVTMDGDGTYPLEQVKSAVRYMEKKQADMVLCSRFPLIDGQAISWWRQLGVFILNTQVKVLFGYPISDVLSGMWVVNKQILRRLSLTEGGWNLSPEIKLAAVMQPLLRVEQFHIRHYEREFGQSKQKLIQTGFEHLFYIVQFWLKNKMKALGSGLVTVGHWPGQLARIFTE